MYLLLVEDEDPKRRHIATYLKEIVPDAELGVARSVRSALDCLDARVPDVIQLDMSLPTFDVGPSEGGGRPQGFGGVELMRNMELDAVICPVIIITGYDAFTKAGGQVGLDVLNAELTNNHPESFRGMIHYNSAYGDWQQRLKELLVQIGVLKS